MVNLQLSASRKIPPEKIVLDTNVELSSCGTINSNGVDFLPSAFKLIANGMVIYIDPIVITDTLKADYIFLTHAHLDHFSIKDIQKISKAETIIICPRSVSKKMSKNTYTIKEVVPGDFLDFDNFSCQAVPAYNQQSVLLGLKAHPKSKQNVGYLLTLNNDLRIYHAGDTDYIPELNQLRKIKLAMIPIGGDKLCMNAEKAAELINKIKPEIVVPMHYETENKEDLVTFKKLLKTGIQVMFLE